MSVGIKRLFLSSGLLLAALLLFFIGLFAVTGNIADIWSFTSRVPT